MSGEGISTVQRDGGWMRHRWARWALVSSIWVFLIALFTLQWGGFDRLPWNLALVMATVDWGPWIVLAPLVLRFARWQRIEAANWKRTVPLHILVGMLVAAGLELGTEQFRQSRAGYFRDRLMRAPGSGAGQMPAPPRSEGPMPGTGSGSGPGILPRFLARPGPSPLIRARLSLPIYLLLVAAAHAFAYHRRSLERERQVLEAEAQLVAARLMALQNQLHPHFLFNTLNAISSLAYTHPKAADEMVCALSELFRSILEVSERPETTLAEELTFVQRYLAIQQTRFADRLEVTMDIEGSTRLAIVPTLILQPLVENAVIHGVSPHSARARIIIRAREKYGRLYLWVSDSGQGGFDGTKNPDGSLSFREGVGLRNTRARLHALHGDNHRLFFKPSDEGGVLVFLDLPFRLGAMNENPHADRRR